MGTMRTEKLGFSLLTTILSVSAATAAPAAKSFRLPDIAVPKTYNLYVEPDLVKKTFAGKETIALSTKTASNELVLNSAEIQVSNAVLTNAKGKTIAKLKVEPEPTVERILFRAEKTLPPGDYSLVITFSGILNNQLRGFYNSKFKDAAGKEHTIATTQMEPADARRMFPCFDEPAYKAVFNLSTTIDKSMVAISNSAVLEEHIDKSGRKKLVKFAPTPPMSTYLVALIIGPFKSTAQQTSDGIPIKVWSLSDRPSMGSYAQKCALKLMHYYNSYFGTPYAAKKLDLIAIPDFEAGAMENLGAITFRESALIIDDKTASTPAKMRVASIVAHEMAHMWFGDLVTMKWWDDLWLNEAFATWMSVKGVDVLKPEWKVWDEFADDRVSAMSTDSLASARQIQCAVNDPSEAVEMFDTITYEKGASILRMLECYVGLDNFQKGIQTYISSHKFANATTDELWKAIGSVTGTDIPGMMSHWVHQAGVPLIRLSDSSPTELTAYQERFFAVPQSDESKRNVLWQVPLAMRALAEPGSAESGSAGVSPASGSTSQTSALMTDRTMGLPRPARVFVGNAHSNGYYRVQYTSESLNSLAASIDQLTVTERLNLLTDQWALSRCGKAPIADTLHLCEAYKKETDPNVLGQLTSILETLSDYVDDSHRKAYEKFVRDELQGQKNELTWTAKADDSDLRKLARAHVLGTLGRYGQDQSVIEKARSLFSQYRKDPKSVDPDLVSTITGIVARNGGQTEYEQITSLWQQAKTPEVEKRNLSALADFRNKELVEKTLNLTLTQKVRTQDAPGLIGDLLSDKLTQDQAWDFTVKRWPEISHRFVEETLPKMMAATHHMSTQKQEAAVTAFTAAHPLKAGKRRIAETLEQIHANVLFRKKSAAELNSWLQNRGN